MGKSHRRNPRQFPIINRLTVCSQLFDNPSHVHGVPHQHGIGQEAETGRLVHDLFVVARLKGSLIGEKEMTRKLVSAFPSIELELHPTSKAWIMDVPKQVETSQSPAQRGEGLGQAVGWGATGETPQDNVGWSRPVMQRGGQSNQLIPLFANDRRINRASDHVIQAPIALGTVQFVELLFGDVQARHQGKA